MNDSSAGTSSWTRTAMRSRSCGMLAWLRLTVARRVHSDAHTSATAAGAAGTGTLTTESYSPAPARR